MLKNMKRPQRPLMFDKVRKTYNAFELRGLWFLLSSLWNHRDVNIRRGEAKTAEVNVARNLKTKIFRIKTFFANSGSQHSLEGFPGQRGKATRYMVLGKLTLSRICDGKLRKDPLLQNSDLIQDLLSVAALGRQRQQQQGGDLGTRF